MAKNTARFLAFTLYTQAWKSRVWTAQNPPTPQHNFGFLTKNIKSRTCARRARRLPRVLRLARAQERSWVVLSVGWRIELSPSGTRTLYRCRSDHGCPRRRWRRRGRGRTHGRAHRYGHSRKLRARNAIEASPRGSDSAVCASTIAVDKRAKEILKRHQGPGYPAPQLADYQESDKPLPRAS